MIGLTFSVALAIWVVLHPLVPDRIIRFLIFYGWIMVFAVANLAALILN